jgi:DNA-binding PadR family transcriptional regulator
MILTSRGGTMTKNDLVVLGLLREQPMYGYQIKQQVEERQLNHWAHVSLASIYNTLNRLQLRGLITSRHEKVGKMPERTVYRLTPKGEKGLAKLVQKALTSEKIPEDDFSVGIAFMYGLDKDQVENCLREKVELLKGRLEYLKQGIQAYQDHIPFNWMSLIQSGMGHIKLEIDHVRGLLKMLKRGNTWEDLIQAKGQKRGRA